MNKLFDNYFLKHALYPAQIAQRPANNLNIIVVLPAFKEPELIRSLEALWFCVRTKLPVEVIIVINCSSNASEEIIIQTENIKNEAENWIKLHQDNYLQFYIIYRPDLLPKDAGVGLARKIGMDEALYRFAAYNREDGIIAAFDADAGCEQNFLTEIESHFAVNQKIDACSIHFEHPIEGEEFSEDIYNRIIEYELYLRYYIDAQRYIGFPYAYQTIGSSFAVRAKAYIQQGGMNKKKAGEDFYFLHKIIPHGHYNELNTTKIIPSPRASDRVPFGTGAAIAKLIINNTEDYLTYNPQAFYDLKQLFETHLNYYNINKINIQNNIKELPISVQKYLINSEFEKEVNEMYENSSNEITFSKRFYQWFNAFRILKFMNFAHDGNYYSKISIREAAINLLSKFQRIDNHNYTTKELLLIYREIDKKFQKIN